MGWPSGSAEMMMKHDYQRLSLVQLRKGCKRPEVGLLQSAMAHLGYYKGAIDNWFGRATQGRQGSDGRPVDGLVRFQADHGLDQDGVAGKITQTLLLRQAEAAGWKPELRLQIQSVITYFETSTTMDAYGMSESDIGDGAGANYGFMQSNSLGSVEHVLKLAGAEHLVDVYRGSGKSEEWIREWLVRPGVAQRSPTIRKIANRAREELKIEEDDMPGIEEWAGRPDLAKYWRDAIEDFPRAYLDIPNPTIQSWFGSVKGIEAQDVYFDEVVLRVAKRQMKDLPEICDWEGHPKLHRYWERALLLFCDTVIQNGGMWSSYARPFWKDTVGVDSYPPRHKLMELYTGTWWDGLLGKYIPYKDLKELWWAELKRQEAAHEGKPRTAKRAANRELCRRIMEENIPEDDPVSKLVLLAQWRARTSSPKWWYIAVACRRMLDATGHGVVNGATIDLVADYRLGVQRDPDEKSPGRTIRETYLKDHHADILEKLGIG